MNQSDELGLKAQSVITESTGGLVQVMAFDSFDDGWGAAFIDSDGEVAIALYEGDTLTIEPFTPEIPASEVVKEDSADLPKAQPL